jgi:hypothetical protein
MVQTGMNYIEHTSRLHAARKSRPWIFRFAPGGNVDARLSGDKLSGLSQIFWRRRSGSRQLFHIAAAPPSEWAETPRSDLPIEHETSVRGPAFEWFAPTTLGPQPLEVVVRVDWDSTAWWTQMRTFGFLTA